jgi:hypothetical protein
MGGAQQRPQIINFLNVVNIDQQRSFSVCQSWHITARHRQPSVTESSVTLPPQYRESTVSSTQQFLTAIERLRCYRCQTRMMLEEVPSGPIGFEHRLFECRKCNHVEISVIASDPFKSNTAGWLAGELRAPN